MLKNHFKYKLSASNTLKMHPIAALIMIDLIVMANTHGHELIVTETVTTAEQDSLAGRVHATHRTGRAFDLSVRNLPEKFITKLKNYAQEKYNNYAAINQDGKKALVVDHVGTARHLHVQIHKSYSLNTNNL